MRYQNIWRLSDVIYIKVLCHQVLFMINRICSNFSVHVMSQTLIILTYQILECEFRSKSWSRTYNFGRETPAYQRFGQHTFQLIQEKI